MLVPVGAAGPPRPADPSPGRARAGVPYRDRLGGRCDPADVLAATDAVVAAVEVVDSRYADRFRLPDSVADNAAAARIVLGTDPVLLASGAG